MVSKWKKNFRFEVKIHEYRNLFELFKLYYFYNVIFQSNTIFLNKKGEARRTHRTVTQKVKNYIE